MELQIIGEKKYDFCISRYYSSVGLWKTEYGFNLLTKLGGSFNK